jgi:hypothetical protein
MEPTETDTLETTGDSETQEQEYIDLYEASDEDLDAFLDSSDEDYQEEGIDEPEEEPVDEQAPTKQQGESIEARLARLEAENANLKNQRRDTQSFLGRRATEIGELRAQLRQAHSQLEAKLTEEEDTLPPREVAKLQGQIERIETRDRELQGEHAMEVAKDTVRKHVQPWQEMNNDIASVLLSDGIPEEKVIAFIQDPYQYASGTEIVHLANRAKAVRIATILLEENKALKAQLAGKPQKPSPARKVVENLSQASQPGVNGVQRGRVPQSRPVSREDVAGLSDAEIDRILKKK